MSPELKAELEAMAKKECWCDADDFMVDDYAGGNMDDAYAGGSSDGEIGLARYLLDKYGDK